jgi:plastocyanin
MKRILLVALAIAALAFGMVPARAARNVPEMLAHAGDRFVPKAPGVTEDLTFVFGPFVIPAGQDSNRYSLDVPFSDGFITAVAPDLVDAKSGAVPSEQDAHIHHAHWLRITTDGTHEYYDENLMLSWVFGTGEEKTQGRLADRSRVERLYGAPEARNREYGIYIDGSTPNLLIYMIHNKTSAPLEVFVVLDVTFVHGTQTQLARLGRDMHPLDGTLWGETRTASAAYPRLSRGYTATTDGVAVASGGHTHPGGKGVVVTNQGPGGACSADLDGDGFAGVTILNSWKLDRIVGSSPFSEDYQMGATKFGWRAPIHKGDLLVQYAPHAVLPGPGATLLNYVSPDGLPHAHYQSMTYTGIYVDRLQVPNALPAANSGHLCDVSNYAASLIGADTFEVQGHSDAYPVGDAPIAALASRFNEHGTGATQGMLNHLWVGNPDRHCGVTEGIGESWNTGACEKAGDVQWTSERVDTDVVHVAAFVYVPGDLLSAAPLPRVTKGATLTFVNEDVAVNIRHSITSCRAPCSGYYVANYPQPDGVFDSGKLGNLDPIDGGLTGSDTAPIWQLPTADLAPGIYTYYCRIHPTMRGGFEVAA